MKNIFITLLISLIAVLSISSQTMTAETQTRVVHQDFVAKWVDTSGVCQEVVTVRRTEGDPSASSYYNAVAHTDRVTVAQAVFPPSGVSCDSGGALPVPPVKWVDILGRTNSATSLASAAALINRAPSFTPQTPGTMSLGASGAVGPSNEPLASFEAKWHDSTGTEHKVITRQKWSEKMESFILRHANAINLYQTVNNGQFAPTIQ